MLLALLAMMPPPSVAVPCMCQAASSSDSGGGGGSSNCSDAVGSTAGFGLTDSLFAAVASACPGLEHVHAHAYEVVIAPVFVLGSGALFRQLLFVTKLPIPHTVLLLLFGGILGLFLQFLALRPLERIFDGGSCDQPHLWRSDVLQRSVTMLATLDPHTLLHIFIPPLIFESAFAIEWHIFYQLKWSTLLLAVPGVVLSTFALGGIINALYGSQDVVSGDEWPQTAGILLGVILSATDPVAVVALLKELGVKPELSIGIEGESLLNDGTALIFFQILIDLVRVPAAASPTANAIVFAFLYKAVFAAMWGLALGAVSTLWLATIFNNPVIEITITLSAAYLTFFSAEALEMSGVLAVVALGLYMGKEGKPRISPEVGHFLAEFWEMLAFVGNTGVQAPRRAGRST